MIGSSYRGSTVSQFWDFLSPGWGWGGYSLYSDERDDRRIFKGLKSVLWYFLGVVRAKFIKRMKPVFVRV